MLLLIVVVVVVEPCKNKQKTRCRSTADVTRRFVGRAIKARPTHVSSRMCEQIVAPFRAAPLARVRTDDTLADPKKFQTHRASVADLCEMKTTERDGFEKKTTTSLYVCSCAAAAAICLRSTLALVCINISVALIR